MAVYAIGDIQGCYDPLRHLLDDIQFDPSVDTLWLAGDLVNRGPKSLKTLRFIKGLGDSAITVLGNHDLHLLALSVGSVRFGRRFDSLEKLLNAPDIDELCDWLRHQPMAHYDENLDTLLESTRKQSSDELKKTATQLEEKNKALKKINVTLADSPENVVKKIKALNKKKLDETNARKRAEDETRTLKKAKQELKKTVDQHEATIDEATKLVADYRELRAFCEEQFTQLKDLVEDDDSLAALPELNEELLKTLASEEEEEED